MEAMAVRKSKGKPSGEAPHRPKPPADMELPVTRAMLGEVRVELIERVAQAKDELLGEIQAGRAETRNTKAGIEADLQEVRSELGSVKTALFDVQAEVHGLRADVARLAAGVEEQNDLVRRLISAHVSSSERRAG